MVVTLQIGDQFVLNLDSSFVNRDMGVYEIDLEREICKPVLKLDLTTHGIKRSRSQNLDCS
jgi:hypothetical protein